METIMFAKASEFEQIWISYNLRDERDVLKKLSDEDYIDYYIWKDLNWKEMYKKHSPNSNVLRGNNPNIIFHGGCLGCLSQRTKGIDRCTGCIFFRFDTKKPNLSIQGEDYSKF